MGFQKQRGRVATALITSLLLTTVIPPSAVWGTIFDPNYEPDIIDEDEEWERLMGLSDEDEDEVASDSNAGTASDSNAGTASDSNAGTATPPDAEVATPPDATPADANEALQFYYNEDGPTIGITWKGVVQDDDGHYFKDSNGNGELDPYEDWRMDPEDRAEDLVDRMSVEEKAGMMMISTRFTGATSKGLGLKTDETGRLDEDDTGTLARIVYQAFGIQLSGGTSTNIEDYHIRHFILRENPNPYELASWVNQMNMKAESTDLGIPVVITSNSRNENAEGGGLGTNEASGVFSTWPGTLGLAAAVRGDDKNMDLIDQFASIARSEWDATGLKKGYMYMADTMTDPRWQRTYGTFGEDPLLNAEIIRHIVPGFQGDGGLESDGVALTIKHFPGGGARENGFDPHYKLGKWNVYQTEGSLEKYHLPAFQAAVNEGVSSIMPYYAIPSAAKSVQQYDYDGNPLLREDEAVGFAFNKTFLTGFLREQMGFEGYINSDSGITRKMDHGVENLEHHQSTALAINAGTDIIGDINEVQDILDAYNYGPDGAESDYYDTHKVPSGYTVEDITLTEETLNRSNVRLLTEMFELGLFENPYRDPDEAADIVDNEENWDAAYDAHLKSVVLLKNTDHVLPLTEEKLEGKKVYARYFNSEKSESYTEQLRDLLDLQGFDLTEDYTEADYALLFVRPSSGTTFEATPGYLELNICTDLEVPNVGEAGTANEGKPLSTTHLESTIEDQDQIELIADAVHSRGGKVISNINFTLAWLVGNVEPYSDALLAGFDTFEDATIDVITGEYAPTGRMPITLPRNDEVIAVDADGICVSRNDVPGYDKDLYMPDDLKDENGVAYAYRDTDGNYYKLDFGLSYDDDDEPDEPEGPGTDEPGTVEPGTDEPEKPATSTGSHHSRGGGSSGSSTSSSSESGRWVKDARGWWFDFTSGGYPASRWLQLTSAGISTWYYFDAEGYMMTGWIEYEGNRYYLHSTADGTEGAMYTGWHQIDGKWYYFKEISDGTKGSLLTNTTTPDGYQVDTEGVWIP